MSDRQVLLLLSQKGLIRKRILTKKDFLSSKTQNDLDLVLLFKLSDGVKKLKNNIKKKNEKNKIFPRFLELGWDFDNNI